MKNIIQVLDLNHKKRLFAVGDIHGSYDLLMNQLRLVGFSFEDDMLISVGDLVDRGVQNRECMDLIGQPWFMAVRGNHEQMCIEGMTSENVRKCHRMSNNGGAWFYELSDAEQSYIVKQMESLPIALEVSFNGEKYGFVHAHVEQNDWNDFKSELEGETGAFSERSAVDLALWCRDRIYQPSNENKYKTVKNIDAVFMGHTITPRPIVRNNCYYIDTGAVHSGNLTIMQIWEKRQQILN